MSAANPNPMEKSMVSVLVVANAGGGRRCCVVFVCLFVYSLIACNLRVMAILQLNTKEEPPYYIPVSPWALSQCRSYVLGPVTHPISSILKLNFMSSSP
jgi:hypothetical protein